MSDDFTVIDIVPGLLHETYHVFAEVGCVHCVVPIGKHIHVVGRYATDPHAFSEKAAKEKAFNDAVNKIGSSTIYIEELRYHQSLVHNKSVWIEVSSTKPNVRSQDSV